jgi:hypothetical protein
VAWTEAASRDNVVPQAVRIYSIGGSGAAAVRTVATAAPGSQVAFVSGDGSNVVFLQAKVANNAATWTVRLVDLSSGHGRDIASSPVATPPGIVPHPMIRDHWIAWAEVTDTTSGSSRAVVYDLNTGTRRTVASNDPAFVAIDGSTLYFDGSDTAGRDVFAVPLDQRGPVQQLTSALRRPGAPTVGAMTTRRTAPTNGVSAARRQSVGRPTSPPSRSPPDRPDAIWCIADANRPRRPGQPGRPGAQRAPPRRVQFRSGIG